MHFDQAAIDELRTGPREVFKVEGTPGLHVIIGKRLISYYRVRKIDGKVKWEPIGIAAPNNDPNRIPLQEARSICHGAPPKSQVKKRGRGSSAYTVASYYSEVYLAVHKKGFPRSWQNFDGGVRRHLLGTKPDGSKRESEAVFELRPGVKFADLKLDSIHHDMIVQLHNWIGEERGFPVAANAMIRRLRQMFSHAQRREAYRGVNPVNCLPNGAEEKIPLFHEPERDRFVDDEEMPKLLSAIAAEIDEDWRDFFHLLLFTGQRKKTLMAMRWNQIRGDRWVVENNYRRYQTRTKNQENLSVRLLPEAVGLLKARKDSLVAAGFGRCPWVFPAKDGRGARRKDGCFIAARVKGGKSHIMDARRAHDRICQRVAKALNRERLDLTLHDYRRTLASWLVAQGAPDPVIADVLGHKNLSSVKRYARLRKGGNTTMEYAKSALNAMLASQDQWQLPADGSAGKD